MSELAFIQALERLRGTSERDRDRAALAALRRGLSGTSDSRAEMHRYVVPFLGSNVSPSHEEDHYLVASLFGAHPLRGGVGVSFGRAMRAVADGGAKESTERRFVACLQATRDDLRHHVRHAVSLLASKDVTLDWGMLLGHLRAWDHPDGWVQRRWAGDFWGRGSAVADTNNETETETEG